MKTKFWILFFCLPLYSLAQFDSKEIAAWEAQSRDVTIIRDNWGIPHIYGKTDADAVFGLLYAQCEDDFKRIEFNYLEKLGRMAEVNGEISLYSDLYIRLIIDSAEAMEDYKKSPAWLKKLLQAYADGINYYLYKHPNTQTALLKRFEPWFPLLWTDGSIGAISTGDINENDVRSFYGSGAPPVAMLTPKEESADGSNGFAFAPSRTASGNAILYINPHTTFYFRPEVQVSSEEGLNVYGAVTWGQFFVYQGFNENCGWMHTSGNTDVADMYAEKVVMKNNIPFYQYEGKEKEMMQKQITLKYRTKEGIATKTFTTYATHHGPVMGKRNGQWVAVKSYNRSLNSLLQSWLRTKAKGLEDYKKVMDLRGNTSNNTVFADSKGNIAYWHGNYIPVRDKKYNWSKAVDGSIAATEYKGLHKVDETVHVYNPTNGWIQNCNSTPFTAAAENSPKKENYPPYMAPDGENFRGVNAVRVLRAARSLTIEKVISLGYDSYLPAFEVLIPSLLKAFDAVDKNDTAYSKLAQPIAMLKAWDYRTNEKSIPTTIAVHWAQKLGPSIQRVYINEGETDQVQKTKQFAATATPQQLLSPLSETIRELEIDHGKWEIAWGDINRFQRLTGQVQERYDDSKESIAVGFAAATWGCLPSFVSRKMPGTKKRYGFSGNSFVCAVEFGKRIKAKSVLAGGENSDPLSKNFKDQAGMYATGQFKEVLFYKEDVMKHAVKIYHPGAPAISH